MNLLELRAHLLTAGNAFAVQKRALTLLNCWPLAGSQRTYACPFRHASSRISTISRARWWYVAWSVLECLHVISIFQADFASRLLPIETETKCSRDSVHGKLPCLEISEHVLPVLVLIGTPKLTRFEPAQFWGGGP